LIKLDRTIHNIKIRKGKSRKEFLRAAAKLEGIYVPSFYTVEYDEDGFIKEFVPKYEDVPTTIHRQVVTELDEKTFMDAPVVPFIKVTQDRVVLEINARRGSRVNEVLLNAEAHFLKFVLPCPVTLQKTALIVVMTLLPRQK